jgi:hypothetical protein
MKPITKNPTDQHSEFHNDLSALFQKHFALLPAPDLLAVASQVVGKLVAFQDARTMTEHQALTIVSANISEGNRQAILGSTKGRRI